MPYPKIPLQPGRHYHIYNHAVGRDDLFLKDDNFDFFLQQVTKWIAPVADLMSYCLMPNHFHLVVRIKDSDYLEELWQEKLKKEKRKKIDELFSDLIVQQFSHCFNSYAQAFNKQNNRSGSLFKQSFQRNVIESTDYLIRVICYVHNNPVNHNFASRREDWKYSSFNAIVGEKPTKVLKSEILELFGGNENLVFVHQKYLQDEIGINS